MTLRMKALIAVVVAMIASAALIYGVSHLILVREMLTIESDNMTKDVSVVDRAIQRELAEIDARVFDYSTWDDTYVFMEEPTQEYIETNAPDNLYSAFGLNLFALVQADGTLAYGRLFDLEKGTGTDPPATLQSLWSPDGPLLTAANTGDQVAGIVNTEEGTFLVACRPVVQSDEQGPVRGVAIMGRLITPSLVEDLSQQTQLDLGIEILDGREISPEAQTALPSLAAPGSVAVIPLDSDTVAGCTTLNDIYGRPAIVLEVQSPRTTYREGIQAVTLYIIAVLGFILAIGVAMYLAMKRWVLRPLRTTVGQVKALAADQTHSGRLNICEGVEFGTLGREINNLLDELEAAQQEVSHLYGVARERAERDALTGLLSRRAIFERLETALSLAHSRQGKLALMMIDVDGFKLFNDTHGHLAGDTLLEALGKALASHTREDDMVGRFGGDEFLLVLPNTDTRGAVSQAKRLLSAMDALAWPSPDGAGVPVSLSIGISAFPQDGADLNELIAFADANLYAAKEKGGHTVSVGVSSGEDGAAGYGFGMLDGLITAVTEKDHYTRRHSEEVASLAVRMAEALGLSNNLIRALRIAGLLHDIGKTGIPASLLLRPGPLNAQEQGLMRRHVEIGVALIRDVPELDDVLSAVGTHHERMDGTGYPRGLKGEEIPLAGRILAVADTYSAMTSHRPYRRAKTPEEARAQILKIAGSQLDSRVVEVFLSLSDPKSKPAEEPRRGEGGVKSPIGWVPGTGVA